MNRFLSTHQLFRLLKYVRDPYSPKKHLFAKYTPNFSFRSCKKSIKKPRKFFTKLVI